MGTRKGLPEKAKAELGIKGQGPIKCGAGKKRSLQVRGNSRGGSAMEVERIGHVWVHSSVGWNQGMWRGVKVTRLCGKVMVTL